MLSVSAGEFTKKNNLYSGIQKFYYKYTWKLNCNPFITK